MSKPIKLTIGMPTYDDFQGVWFSVQALRLYHREVMDRCELLVVDNRPQSAEGVATQEFIDRWVSSCRYVPMATPVGTAPAKNRVFAEATGDAVLCMDSHVLIAPGAIAKLIDYYEANPDTNDLLSGPLIYDNHHSISTHFADEWRGEMWGTWATDPRGEDPDGEPFEIPGTGMGAFSCRREAWLGFNTNLRGFGGEEMVIHAKYRCAGHRCLCLPFLRWNHRFCRPAGVPYPLLRDDKVRNYILGMEEVGLSLGPLDEHFVRSGLMTPAEWKRLRREAAAMQPPPRRQLGDTVEAALKVVGITQERVSAWLGRPCNCEQRKQRLNQLGEWARRVVSGEDQSVALFEEETTSDV